MSQGQKVQGFSFEFFTRLHYKYPDLNMACFFEKEQPIRRKHLVKNNAETTEGKSLEVMETAVLGRLNSLLDSKEREIELLNGQVTLLMKNMNLLQEMLDDCKNSKGDVSQKRSQP